MRLAFNQLIISPEAYIHNVAGTHWLLGEWRVLFSCEQYDEWMGFVGATTNYNTTTIIITIIIIMVMLHCDTILLTVVSINNIYNNIIIILNSLLIITIIIIIKTIYLIIRW